MTGATSGIGEALCDLLAKKGVSLIISGRNRSRLEQLAHRLGNHVEVVAVPADLCKKEDRKCLLDSLLVHPPDLIINNAGLGLYGEAASYSVDQEMDILEVNGNALLEITLTMAKRWLKEEKKGVILNVASIVAYHPMPYSTVYAASKSFVRSVSVGLDLELKKYGIRVLVACPGMVATNFSKRAAQKEQLANSWFAMSAEDAAEAIWRQIERQVPCQIFDWRYRLLSWLIPFFPERWVGSFVGSFVKSRVN